MVFESEATDLGDDVDDAIRMFERSKVGKLDTLLPIKPARVLLALDGSPQDQCGIDAANHLRERFNTETLLIDARAASMRDEDDSTDLATDRSPEVVGSRPIVRDEEESYEKIVAAVGQHQLDLVIVPCPFGRDFDDVGSDSVGTVTDVLLSRCPVPMLVIRRDDQKLDDAVKSVAVIVGGECDAERKAATWGFSLVAKSGAVTLNLVIEREQFQNIRSIVEALTPGKVLSAKDVQDALAKTHQALHSAMANTATALECEYSLLPQAGDLAPPNLVTETKTMLLVLPLEVDDRFGQGFVQDRIRRSPHPVLVVPSHVAIER